MVCAWALNVFLYPSLGSYVYTVMILGMFGILVALLEGPLPLFMVFENEHRNLPADAGVHVMNFPRDPTVEGFGATGCAGLVLLLP